MEPILLIVAGVVIVTVIGFVVSKVGGTSPASPTPDDSGPTQHGEGDKPDMEGYPAGSRPAGPGAEAMNAEQPGSPVTGTPPEESSGEDAVKPSDARTTSLGDEE